MDRNPALLRQLCALAAASLMALPCAATEQLTAWCYYNSPPFVIGDAHAGLAKDVVDYLNAGLQGRYQLVLEQVPRNRLISLMNQREGMVLLVPSVVFPATPYHWSVPILNDRQELVSRADHPIEFAGAAALAHVKLGGILGHKYPALDGALKQGTISMFRVRHEFMTLDMLMAGRLDATTLATTSLEHWLFTHPGMERRIYRSRQDLGQYTRHMLFTPGRQQARDAVDLVLRRAWHDPAWHKLFSRYGVVPLEPPK